MDLSMMPPDVAEVFGQLWQEVTQVHTRWREFLKLYGNEENVRVMNESAPAFFVEYQRVVSDYVLLEICRLTDPAGKDDKTNLSLATLVSKIDETAHGEFKKQVSVFLAIAKSKFETAGKHRNKRIAHLDLEVRLGSGLPPVTTTEIDDALQAIKDAMDLIQGHFTDTDTAYGSAIFRGGGEELIYWLRRGLDNPRKPRE
jgi:AbiU2